MSTHRYPQIHLLRTGREPLYAAWNRAIPLARGKYLTANANTDDRHHRDYAEKMAAALDEHSEVALAYADQLLSQTANEDFDTCAHRGAVRRNWPDFTPADLMLRCITGSQPMWRRQLHDRLGLFDTRYRIAADYDMWIRAAALYELMHLPFALGTFYDSPSTLSGSNNRIVMDTESLEIKRRHLQLPRYRDVPGLRARLSKELFGVGYRYIATYNDGAAAAPFIREAIRLDPSNLSFMKTYLVRCLFA